MFWKICFVIYSLLFMLMISFGYSHPILEPNSNLASLSDTIQTLFIVLFLALFFALGWKKALYSKKAVNYVLGGFILSIFLGLINFGTGAWEGFLESQAETQLPLIAGIFIVVLCVAFGFICLNVLAIPFYIGIYKYKKNIETFDSISKPYWKILTGFSVLAYIPFLIFVGLHYKNIPMYNYVDYFAILSCIYEIFFLIGFSFDRKPKFALFWQITCVPYLIGSALTYFYLSPQFKADFPLLNFSGNVVDITVEVIFYVLFAYVLYKYAFGKNSIEENKQEI